MKEDIKLLYIDLFCGAGGTSTGVEFAQIDGAKCARVIACVNHDKNAIASHAANHPEALHFTEDIRTLDVAPIVRHLDKYRQRYPEAMVVLWASLECTNFSRAKGGLPRDADSRTLAEHLFRYIEAISPDYIQIENVEEFMSWGELDENGKPLSKDRGNSYIRWLAHVKSYGYEFEHRILNSADYGAYTSRKRFFGIFAKHGLPIVFPTPTHSRVPSENKSAWKPVREVLDLDDEGKSIFGRKRPLAEASLERIYAGLIKFVAGGMDAFLVKYNSMSQSGKYNAPGINAPCPVVATQNRLGVAQVSFLSKAYSGAPASKNVSIDSPAGTITTVDHHSFISVHYGNGFVRDIESPAPTLTTKDRCALITSVFIDQQFGNGRPASVDKPCNTITTVPKYNVVACKPSHFLVNPQYKSAGSSVDNPCFTLIASMDKRPPYLAEIMYDGQLPDFIHIENNRVIYNIDDDDSEIIRKIKEFMAMYGIIDVTMRMLKVDELKQIMGFPKNYILVGTQAEQKKYIGNAVEVNMARSLCEALCKTIDTMRLAV